jgi:hypothetical protein
MSAKVQIKSIEIKIGDNVIKLTVEQAKELKDILGEMYAEPDMIISRQYPWKCPVTKPFVYPWQHWDYTYIAGGTAFLNLNI